MMTFYVLTDFSATATNALHHAIVLARLADARIQLLHVVPQAACVAAACFNSAVACQASRTQHALQSLAARVRRYVPCSGLVLTGNPDQQLPTLLEARPDGVVVVGNSNPAKRTRTAWTSTSLYLIRTLTLPLLVVPATYRAGQLPRRLVFDLDRKPVRLPRAAAVVPELLSRLTASRSPLLLSGTTHAVDDLLHHVIPEVVGIHVYTSEAAPEAHDIAHRIRQTGLLAGIAHTVATSRHPSVEEGIRHTAARQQADLLSFVARQRMYPGREFLQSVTAGLIAHSRIPVLAIPEQ